MYTTSAIGGKPAVRYDGVDDWMAIDDRNGLLRNESGATIFVVGAPQNASSTSAGEAVMVSSGTDPDSPRAGLGHNGWSQIRAVGERLDGGATHKKYSAREMNSSAHIMTGRFDFANASLSTYIDGTLAGGPSTFGTAGSRATPIRCGGCSIRRATSGRATSPRS